MSINSLVARQAVFHSSLASTINKPPSMSPSYRHLGPSRLLIMTPHYKCDDFESSSSWTTNNSNNTTIRPFHSSQVTFQIIVRSHDIKKSEIMDVKQSSSNVGTCDLWKDCRFTLNILSSSRLSSLMRSLKRSLTKKSLVNINEIEFVRNDFTKLSNDMTLREILKMANLSLKINNNLMLPVYHRVPNFDIRQSLMRLRLHQGNYIFPLFNDVYNFSIKNLKCHWYAYSEMNENDAILVGNDISLELVPDLVGKYLKFYCFIEDDHGIRSPTRYSAFEKPVHNSEASLASNFKKFEQKISMDCLDEIKNNLRVGTYNVLGNNYITTIESQQWYDYCPKYFRQTTFRPSRLMTELLSFNCDIMLLQEIENYGYVLDILEKDHKIGFLFNEGKSRTNSQYANQGIAILYKHERFEQIDSIQGLLSDLFNYDPSCRTITNLCCRLLPNSKILDIPTKYQISILRDKMKYDSRLIFVMNCHLKSIPLTDDERLFQTLCLLAKYDSVINNEKYSTFEKYMIFGGDFNTVPLGSPIKYMQGLTATNENTIASNAEIPSNTKFFDILGDKRFKTNLVGRFNDCIDYIFTGKSQFQCLNVFNPIDFDEELANGNKLLPNVGYLSDHLPIIANLKIL